MTRPTHMDGDGNPCFPEGVEGAEPLPDGYWEARDLEAARGAKLAALSVRFAAEIAKGCTSPKGQIQCDDQAQARINFVIDVAEDAETLGQSVPSSVKWTMADRSQVTHTLSDLRLARLSMGLGFQAKMAVRQAKEAALRGAVDAAEIEAIDIAAGWP